MVLKQWDILTMIGALEKIFTLKSKLR